MEFHTGYYGITMSGKTTMARHIARECAKAKHAIVVFDPIGSGTHGGDWPKESRIYSDPEHFGRDIARTQNAQVFIDEADLIFPHANKDNHWLMRRGRHQGLYVHLITQRPNLVDPSCRSMCGRAYLFRLNKTDRVAILADHGHEDIMPSTGHGDFIMVDNRSSDIMSGNVFKL